MATSHKRNSLFQLVGLNKHEETFHTMMESCASFDTFVQPSLETNNKDDKPGRKSISRRIYQFKIKPSTIRDSLCPTNAPPPSESDCEVTSKSGDSKHNSADKSRSPAPRRGTGGTEKASDLESGESEIDDDDDDVIIEGVSVVSGYNISPSSKCISLADESSRRKRRSFLGALSITGHNSNKMLEPQISPRKFVDESKKLNESQSSKFDGRRNTIKLVRSKKSENEDLRLKESQSTKVHGSESSRLNRSKELDVEADSPSSQLHDNQNIKINRSKDLDGGADTLHESAKLHGSHLFNDDQSKGLDVSADLLDDGRSLNVPTGQRLALNESQRSRLNENQNAPNNFDNQVPQTDHNATQSPKRSPRSRTRSEREGQNHSRSTSKNLELSNIRTSRRSLSPRRRLIQPTLSQCEGGDVAEDGLSRPTDVSPRKRGTSPRRKANLQNLSSTKRNSSFDSVPKISAIGSGDIKVAITRRVSPHLGNRRYTSDSNANEQNECITQNENIMLPEVGKIPETSPRKTKHESDVSESNCRGFDPSERRMRSTSGDLLKRSRSVSAVVNRRSASKPREASSNPNIQKGKSGACTNEEHLSDNINQGKDLRSKIEQSSHSGKRLRGSPKSVSPGSKLGLKNMLEAAAPLADRKCLTVVSPKDYEKKKASTDRKYEVERKGFSPLTFTDRSKMLVHRVSPKESPISLHKSSMTMDSLKLSMQKSPLSSTGPIPNTKESSNVALTKSPSSQRVLITSADQPRRIKTAEKSSERDARGRALSRVERLKEELHDARRPRSVSTSTIRNEDQALVASKEQTPVTVPDAGNQRLLKSPGTSLRKSRPTISPAKPFKSSTTTIGGDLTPSKSQKRSIAERQEDFQKPSKVSLKPFSSPVSGEPVALQSHGKSVTPSRREKNDVRGQRRSPSKSPSRHAIEVHGQRDGGKVPSISGKLSKRNKEAIRKAISARNLDGHQSHDFEVEERTNSGTIVKRKLKVVPASDAEKLGSILLRKDATRGSVKGKSCPLFLVAAQLHIPDLDESQKSNLKVKYTEYSEISMLDNYVDNDKERGDIP